MIQALQRAADPVAEDGYSRLDAVVQLAWLLAKMQDGEPHSVAFLPMEVLSAPNLDPQWLRNTFPDWEKFVNVA